jgi:hypothetical protein
LRDPGGLELAIAQAEATFGGEYLLPFEMAVDGPPRMPQDSSSPGSWLWVFGGGLLDLADGVVAEVGDVEVAASNSHQNLASGLTCGDTCIYAAYADMGARHDAA